MPMCIHLRYVKDKLLSLEELKCQQIRITGLFLFIFICLIFSQISSKTEDDFVSSHGIVYRILWWTAALTFHACRYYFYWILGTEFMFLLGRNYCYKILKSSTVLKKWSVLVVCFDVQISTQFDIVRKKDAKWASRKLLPFKRYWIMRAYGQPVRYDWSWFLHDKQSGRFYQIIFDFEKYKFQKDKLRYRSIKVTDLN